MGRYQLIRKLATGGMAEVFLAKATGPMGFEKTLVVKRILPHLAEDPEFVGMFLSEAKLAALLNHANIVQIFDFGLEDEAYFIAMEHVDGPNLRVLLRQAFDQGTLLPFPVCIRIVSLACEGLAHAHELSHPETGEPLHLVHRDISADNILLSRTGGVKVVDFGIAKATTQTHRTRTGLLKGKVSYMSPEHLMNEPLDVRADVYSLGVVLYELVTGQKPFDAQSEVGLMQAILHEAPVDLRLRRRDVPGALDRIVRKALAKDREERYASCREFQAALDQYLLECGQFVGSAQIAELVRQLAPPSGSAPVATPVPRSAPTREAPRETVARTGAVDPEPTVETERSGTEEALLASRVWEDGERRQRARWGMVGVIGFAFLVGGGAFLIARPSEPGAARPAEEQRVHGGRAPAPASLVPPERAPLPATAQQVSSAIKAARPPPEAQGQVSEVAAAPVAATPLPTPTARLEVISRPVGRVRINGKAVGTSPVKTNVPAGSVQIEISGPDFSRTETVELESGDEVTRTITLEKGWLQIRGRPEEAIVTLDGRELGSRPESQEIYEGSHRLEVVDPETQKRVRKECTVQPREYKLCKFEIQE